MAGRPTNFQLEGDAVATLELWRTLQVRQLFRFSLESLFYWISKELRKGSRTSQNLVEEILKQTGIEGSALSIEINKFAPDGNEGPVDLIGDIEAALIEGEQKRLISEVLKSLAFIFREIPVSQEVIGRPDRLPVVQACREFVRCP